VVRFNGRRLRGFKNHLMTAFTPNFKNFLCWLACDPRQASREGAEEFYNILQGKTSSGGPFINPHTGDSTVFPLSGDPALGTGWYEGLGWPGGPTHGGDRRLLLSSGPLTMAPGDSQEVIIAILIAHGEDHLDSISELKRKSQAVQIAYDQNFRLAPIMEKPVLAAVPADNGLTLYWETNAEMCDKTDPFLKYHDVSDSTYTFEGYRIWQYRDLDGTDSKVLATYDIRNEVIEIYGRRTINGFPAEVVEIYGQNEGVRRSHMVTENIYNKKPLNNGNPYYFAVTAYAYSEHSDPTFIESEPQIIEVIPGLQKIDQTSNYDSGEKIIAEHSFGYGDGLVELIVVDPNVLTGDEYRVSFKGSVEGFEDDLSYTFINYTINDTILTDYSNFVYNELDTVEAQVIDGFKLKIQNTAIQQIYAVPGKNYAIRDIMEINGPGGAALDPPLNVFESLNSTADWEINTYGDDLPMIQNINMEDAAAYHNYEIRFTPTGSEYYLTGGQIGFKPWLKNDHKAVDRVPFEIWDTGRSDSDEDDIRLTIKVLDAYMHWRDDSNRVVTDSIWSQLENGDWEPIIGFLMDSTYQEPLPESSGRTRDETIFKIGKFIISGELPAEGTVIRINTWKPLSAEDVFSVVAEAPNTKNYAAAKTNLEEISVFPNPFLGTALYSGYLEQNAVRFTNLPVQVTIRIFSLAGVFVRRLEKNDDNPYLDWDLRNNGGQLVGSGVYIAHLEMPNIGEKVMKLAIIQENQ